jgi:hypothetical protein
MCGVECSSCPVSSFVVNFSAANGDSFPYLSSLSSFSEKRNLRMSEANPLHFLSIKKIVSEIFAPDYLTYRRQYTAHTTLECCALS